MLAAVAAAFFLQQLTCARDQPTVVVGLAWPEEAPHALMVARAVIDSTASPGDPRIVVMPNNELPDRTTLQSSVDQALQFAASADVIAVVGHPSSTETVLAAPIYAEAGIPLVVPTATTRRLADAGPLVFPLAPNDSLEGEFIAEFAHGQLAARSALVFYAVDDYGAGLAAGVSSAFERLAVRVIDRVPVRLDHQCPPFNTTNPYEDQVDASFRKGVPDVVVVAGRRWEVGCIARAVNMRVPGTPVIGGDGATPADSVLTDTAGPALDSLYIVVLWLADGDAPEAARFASLFQRITGRTARPEDALVHDAIMLIVAAVREGGANRASVRAYLEGLGRARPAYAGITGAITFQAGAQRPLHMMQIRSGRQQRVEAR
jgi:branched-chain amino acid transport system substrate-binding protein